MLLWIIPRDDGAGLLPTDNRDGDILQSRPDSFEGSIGLQEKKSYLIVKVPDPPNLAAVSAELVTSIYRVAASGGAELAASRRWRVDWRTKFSAEEITTIENTTLTLPDGNTQSGGTVTSGVVSGLFTVADLIQK